VPLAVRGPGRLAAMAAELPAELSADTGRAAVWAAAVRIAGDHPLLGTGLGTFGGVFPRYRPLAIQSAYTHAHQDYLQWLAETGVLGGLAGALLLAGLAWTAARAVQNPDRGADRMLATGVAAGLGGLALHGLVDFNGHIPANTLLAAALAGVLVVLARPAHAELAP
jgi:O-antigen ligase